VQVSHYAQNQDQLQMHYLRVSLKQLPVIKSITKNLTTGQLKGPVYATYKKQVKNGEK